jgi:hypothetical protein
MGPGLPRPRVPQESQPPREPLSALNLRLLLAVTGAVSFAVLSVVLFWAHFTALGIVAAVMAVLAAGNAGYVQYRRRQRRRREHGQHHTLFE